jgi:hypothetical protein
VLCTGPSYHRQVGYEVALRIFVSIENGSKISKDFVLKIAVTIPMDFVLKIAVTNRYGFCFY